VCVATLVLASMSTSPNDDRESHQSAISFSGPHSFVKSSVKSVIKALSGRRQSPSPTFQRSLIGAADGAERTDRDYLSERILLAAGESEDIPLPEAEVRPDLEDSAKNTITARERTRMGEPGRFVWCQGKPLL
jgi:hypothetical protein